MIKETPDHSRVVRLFKKSEQQLKKRKEGLRSRV